MIDIKNPVDCCGCDACENICPQKCITLHRDKEGFKYPEVDILRCIDCHLCERVCPVINPIPDKITHKERPLVYAAYSKEDFVRIESTSGGLFSALASKMFAIGGYVAGAVYSDDLYTVNHIVTNDKNQLPYLRSSKYLQSDSLKIYSEIKQLLKKGEKVLFCGTPCQVVALRNFLLKDYDNLITVDFICLGVNSPLVYKKYVEYLEDIFKSKATSIKFKNKTFGWHQFSTKVDFLNGKEYIKDRYSDPFMIGYLQSSTFVRPSCYHCKFKGFPISSDITLADFWGIENIDKSLDQDKGTSLVMVNSEQGADFFESIKATLVYKEFTLEQALECNPAQTYSVKESFGSREKLFEDINKYRFDKVAKRNFPKKISLVNRLFKKINNTIGFSPIQWCRFAIINSSSKIVRRGKRAFIIPFKYSIIELHNNAKLVLNGQLMLGFKQVKKSKLETRILIEKNGIIEVNGNFSIFAGSYIRIIENGKLTLNGGFINENVQITCSGNITIGQGCTIGRDVVIRSYDGHIIELPDYQISKDIVIGKHVWIGQGATILKGVTIGDGAIIASGAIVTKDIPEKCLAVGIPAKVVKTNVSWRE